MDVVEEFVAAYERERDRYASVAREAHKQLEAALRLVGLRAIVSSRVKSPERLADKVRERVASGKCRTLKEIDAAIVDRVGLRVALYFPGEADAVQDIIAEIFDLTQEPKLFPNPQEAPRVENRFSGYGARHFRVRLRTATDDRYLRDMVEVQVATVLMHAWAEVAHDRDYKQLNGTLSDTESALLDQLNGLVLTGEIALDQLQSAARRRSETEGFRDHFELAGYLRRKRPDATKELNIASMASLGRLFNYLEKTGQATVADIEPHLESLQGGPESRSVPEQLIDLMVAGSWTEYEKLLDTPDAATPFDERRPAAGPGPGDEDAVEDFVQAWAEFESALALGVDGEGSFGNLLGRATSRRLLPDAAAAEVVGSRAVRDQIVHAGATFEPETLRERAARLRELSSALRSRSSPRAHRH